MVDYVESFTADVSCIDLRTRANVWILQLIRSVDWSRAEPSKAWPDFWLVRYALLAARRASEFQLLYGRHPDLDPEIDQGQLRSGLFQRFRHAIAGPVGLLVVQASYLAASRQPEAATP